MQSYNNCAYMHGYCSNCAFMHNFTPTDVGFFFVKMCKITYFLYFARLWLLLYPFISFSMSKKNIYIYIYIYQSIRILRFGNLEAGGRLRKIITYQTQRH